VAEKRPRTWRRKKKKKNCDVKERSLAGNKRTGTKKNGKPQTDDHQPAIKLGPNEITVGAGGGKPKVLNWTMYQEEDWWTAAHCTKMLLQKKPAKAGGYLLRRRGENLKP